MLKIYILLLFYSLPNTVLRVTPATRKVAHEAARSADLASEHSTWTAIRRPSKRA